MQRLTDAIVGVGVAVASLPLIVAVAFACGIQVEIVLVGAAVAGIVFTLFAGPRVRITAPTIVLAPFLVAGLRRHGVDGLVIAGVLAGLIQVLLGAFGCARAFAGAPSGVVRGLSVAAGVAMLVELGNVPVLPLITWPVRPPDLSRLDGVGVVGLAFELALLSTLVSLGPTPVRRSADCDRELVALGLGNTASAMLTGAPLTVAANRTRMAEGAGAGSPVTNAAHALSLACFALAWRTGVPRVAVIGVIAVAAVIAIDPAGRAHRLASSPVELLSTLSILACAAVLGFGPAVLLATVVALLSFARANRRLLVQIRDGALLEVTLVGELLFAGRTELAPLAELNPIPPAIVLNLTSVSLVDASGLAALAEIVHSLRVGGCTVTIVATSPLCSLLADDREHLA